MQVGAPAVGEPFGIDRLGIHTSVKEVGTEEHERVRREEFQVHLVGQGERLPRGPDQQ